MADEAHQQSEGGQSPNISAGGDVTIHYSSTDSLWQKGVTYLPHYISDFGSVFIGPKTFIAERNTLASETFRDSLLFLSYSVLVFILSTWPLLPDGTSILKHLGTNAVGVVLTVVILAVSLRLAWRVVGGRAPVKSFFVTYSYFGGVSIVVGAVFHLLADGMLKLFDLELYRQVLDARLGLQSAVDLFDSTLYWVSAAVRLAGPMIMCWWGVIAWGAYRELNQLSKRRSLGAFFVFSLISVPALAIVILVTVALSETPQASLSAA